MAVLLGRNSRIKLDGTIVAKMTSMSVTIGNETIDITSFGDVFATSAIGMRNWSASISGFYDKTSAGQNSLREANENATVLQSLEFWIDAVSFYNIIVVDADYDGAIIDSFTITSDNNSVVGFEMSITGSGQLQYMAESSSSSCSSSSRSSSSCSSSSSSSSA